MNHLFSWGRKKEGKWREEKVRGVINVINYRYCRRDKKVQGVFIRTDEYREQRYKSCHWESIFSKGTYFTF